MYNYNGNGNRETRMWELTNLRQELKRQRGRLLWLVERIDEKNLRKQAFNKELLRQRKYYVPKNNGKGRPAHKFKHASKEDERRRIQYLAEISVLDWVLSRDLISEGDICLHLESLAERPLPSSLAEEERSAERSRTKKIKQLLTQFGSDDPASGKGSAISSKVWREERVRARLMVLRDSQQNDVRTFNRLPIRTLEDEYLHDCARAKLAVFDRFWESNHLFEAEAFFAAAKIIRDQVRRIEKIHDHACYDKAWQDAVDALVADLAGRFGQGAPGNGTDGGKVFKIPLAGIGATECALPITGPGI